MKFGKILAAVAAGVVACSVQAENSSAVKVGGFFPIEGFFSNGVSENWKPLEGFEPVKITILERDYPVLLRDTDDTDAAINVLRTEMGKYYDDATVEQLVELFLPAIEANVNSRSNLNMSKHEVLDNEAGRQATARSMEDFFGYEDIDVYADDPAVDGKYFKNFSVAQLFNMIERLQVMVRRNTLEIIAPVGQRGILVYDKFFPATPGDQMIVSGNLFSRFNPSEEEVAKKAGLPSTLDVEQQVLQKKIGGFAIMLYDQDQNYLGQMMKLFVTEDYQRRRVSWDVNIPKINGEYPKYFKLALVVAPANGDTPMDDPIEFSDVRVQLTRDMEL